MKTIILALFFAPAVLAARVFLSKQKFNDLLNKIGQVIQ